MPKFKLGAVVKRIMGGPNDGLEVGMIGTVVDPYGVAVEYTFRDGMRKCSLGNDEGNLELVSHQELITKTEKNEENKMELKELKMDNLLEAKKKAEEEKTNAEIEFAKKSYRDAIDNIDKLDREINALVEKKKPFIETLELFGKK